MGKYWQRLEVSGLETKPTTYGKVHKTRTDAQKHPHLLLYAELIISYVYQETLDMIKGPKSQHVIPGK